MRKNKKKQNWPKQTRNVYKCKRAIKKDENNKKKEIGKEPFYIALLMHFDDFVSFSLSQPFWLQIKEKDR